MFSFRRGKRGHRGKKGNTGASASESSVITSLYSASVDIGNNESITFMLNVGSTPTRNPAGYWNIANPTRITNTTASTQVWIVSVAVNVNTFSGAAGDYIFYAKIDGAGFLPPFQPFTLGAGFYASGAATYTVTLAAGSYMEIFMGTPGATQLSGVEVTILQL